MQKRTGGQNLVGGITVLAAVRKGLLQLFSC
jgi:hypothetical protein